MASSEEEDEGGDRSMDRMRSLMLSYYGMESEAQAEKQVADCDIDAAGFNVDSYMKVGGTWSPPSPPYPHSPPSPSPHHLQGSHSTASNNHHDFRRLRRAS